MADLQISGTFRLYVNEGMWRHDQDSGMEPAIARWAVNLNEASGTKTCDFMSKLMSTRASPVRDNVKPIDFEFNTWAVDGWAHVENAQQRADTRQFSSATFIEIENSLLMGM